MNGVDFKAEKVTLQLSFAGREVYGILGRSNDEAHRARDPNFVACLSILLVLRGTRKRRSRHPPDSFIMASVGVEK